jgi:hypothetical protein
MAWFCEGLLAFPGLTCSPPLPVPCRALTRSELFTEDDAAPMMPHDAAKVLSQLMGSQARGKAAKNSSAQLFGEELGPAGGRGFLREGLGSSA